MAATGLHPAFFHLRPFTAKCMKAGVATWQTIQTRRGMKSRVAESGFRMIPTHGNNGPRVLTHVRTHGSLKEDTYELLLWGSNTRCPREDQEVGLKAALEKNTGGRPNISQQQTQLVTTKRTNVQTNKNPQSKS